jgi:hypothetical protein
MDLLSTTCLEASIVDGVRKVLRLKIPLAIKKYQEVAVTRKAGQNLFFPRSARIAWHRWSVQSARE